MLTRVEIVGALVPLERSGSSECVDEELMVLATFLETERRQRTKSPPATASAMAVVPRATPTMAPVAMDEFEVGIGAAVCEAGLVELGVDVADGEAVTVLVTTALTRSNEEEFASPRVEESFCFTQPREMKYLCPRIRPVA